MTTLTNDYGCYLGSPYERRIVAWMTERGHTGYERDIGAAQDAFMETIGEAGRYWMHCTFTREALAKINADIRETFEAATQRYEDWATD